MKIKTFALFVLLLLAVSSGLFFAQREIVENLAGKYHFYYSVSHIYLFHFLVTLVVFFVVFLFSRTKPLYIRFGFVGMILLKLFAALLFLWPLITLEDVSKIPDLCSFFAPYFIFLLIEVLLTIRVLRLTYDHS